MNLQNESRIVCVLLSIWSLERVVKLLLNKCSIWYVNYHLFRPKSKLNWLLKKWKNLTANVLTKKSLIWDCFNTLIGACLVFVKFSQLVVGVKQEETLTIEVEKFIKLNSSSYWISSESKVEAMTFNTKSAQLYGWAKLSSTSRQSSKSSQSSTSGESSTLGQSSSWQEGDKKNSCEAQFHF